MKKLFNLLSIVLILAGNNILLAQQDGKEPARIVGVAKDAKTGDPVGYATAALYKKGMDVSMAGAVADGDGKFFITG
ncbi:MAG: hypothetical protein NXH89_07335, partial [Cyclobacteriaceae bacterium]|nr:hypothetical protein [Cyclobacteriaceae bacterium]